MENLPPCTHAPSGTTNPETPFQGVPFSFSQVGDIGPPFIATLNLPRLTIGLPVWLFDPVILAVPNASNVNSPS